MKQGLVKPVKWFTSRDSKSFYPYLIVNKAIMERKIYNPIQKDQVRFLKTSADTNSECTLVEVTLADGVGVGLHYHKTYSEKFDCLEEEVEVQLGKTIHKLQPGL